MNKLLTDMQSVYDRVKKLEIQLEKAKDLASWVMRLNLIDTELGNRLSKAAYEVLHGEGME